MNDKAPKSAKIPKPANRLSDLVIKNRDVFLHLNGNAISDVFLSAVVSELNTAGMRLKSGDRDGCDNIKTQQSCLRAVANLARVNLFPGDTLGHAYLVPYYDKRASAKIFQLIIGYKGYLELAFRVSFLVQCDPEVVLDPKVQNIHGQSETFDHGHDKHGPWVKHFIPTPRPQPSEENVIAAYCTYKTTQGGIGSVVVDSWELKYLKGKSPNDLWAHNFHAMALKTPIRRAAKRWRIGGEMSVALRLDDQADQAEDGVEQDDVYSEPESARQIDLDDMEDDNDEDNGS